MNDWIVVKDDRPVCERCGATWDRTAAAEAEADNSGGEVSALLLGLAAFAAHHAACDAGGERATDAALAEQATQERAARPVLGAAAGSRRRGPVGRLGSCPDCGQAFRGGKRRCYGCRPGGRKPGSAACRCPADGNGLAAAAARGSTV